MKFTITEKIILTGIYRRLNYFHKGNLNEPLLLLSFPSHVKTLKDKGILKVYRNETKKVLNWYGLTGAGKELFKNHITPLTEKDNTELFEGRKLYF